MMMILHFCENRAPLARTTQVAITSSTPGLRPSSGGKSYLGFSKFELLFPITRKFSVPDYPRITAETTFLR